MHDPRIGRFFATDPLAPDYPWNSPYAFSENRVVDSRELEGLEQIHYKLVLDSQGNTSSFEIVSNTDKWWVMDYKSIGIFDEDDNYLISFNFRKQGDLETDVNFDYQSNRLIDFSEFAHNPIESLLSGEFIPNEKVLLNTGEEILMGLIFRRVSLGKNKRSKKSLVSSSTNKMPAWLVRIRDGIKFQQERLAKLDADGVNYKGNINLVPQNGKGKVKGNSTYADALIKNDDGTYTIIEYKLTSKTQLRPGQNASKKHVQGEGSNQEFEVRSKIGDTEKGWSLQPGDKIKVKEYKIEVKEQGGG